MKPAPDFYSMIVERVSDKAGYDVVFIDPVRRGSHASRFSHSCDPNLCCVPMSYAGKITLAVYALRDIKPGEELTFNYNSVTESEQEYRDAVCLCGTLSCSGYYLGWNGMHAYGTVLDKHQLPVHVTASILRSESGVLSSEDQAMLDKFHIGSSMLQGSPDWLKVFVSHVCRYIDKETALLSTHLVDKNDTSLENAQDVALGVASTRLQNLAITIDKVKFYLRLVIEDGEVPPLSTCSAKDVVKLLWNNEDSIISFVKTALETHAGEKAAEILSKIKRNSKIPLSCRGLSKVNRLFLWISERLRKLQSTKAAFHTAAADLLYLYANTQIWFQYNSRRRRQFKPRPIKYRSLGFDHEGETPGKIYCSRFDWGQLVYWMRQTIQDPAASLSNAKKGVFCLPHISCCYSKRKSNKILHSYDKLQRKKTLDCLEHVKDWSCSSHWRYNTRLLPLGSPVFDFIFLRDSSRLRKVVKCLSGYDVGG